MVQWLRLHVSTAKGRLVGKLRSCMLHGVVPAHGNLMDHFILREWGGTRVYFLQQKTNASSVQVKGRECGLFWESALPDLGSSFTFSRFSFSLPATAPAGWLSKCGSEDHLIGEEMTWGQTCNREPVRNAASQASPRPGESEYVFISTRPAGGVKSEKRCYWALGPSRQMRE